MERSYLLEEYRFRMHPLFIQLRRFSRTVQARLIFLVLLVAVPALGAQVYQAWNSLRVDFEKQSLESVRLLDHAQSDFRNLINDTRIVFTELDQLDNVRNFERCEEIDAELRRAFERLTPRAMNLGLVNMQGEVLCAVNAAQKQPVSEDVDVQSLIGSLGKYRLDPDNGLPSVSLTHPLRSTAGAVEMALFATFDAAWLDTWQGEVVLLPGSAVTLFTPSGEVIWRTVNGEQVEVDGLTGAQVAWFDSGAGEENAAMEGTDFDGVVRLNSVVPIDAGGQTPALLHLGYPVSQIYEELYARLRWQVGLMLALIVVVMLLAGWGSETMFLRPLRELMGVVKRVQHGDLSARVSGLKGLGELDALAQSFDQMTGSLQHREAERMQLEERFRAAFESSAIGMSLLALDGKILAANDAVCKMSGYSEAELRQRYESQMTFPPDAEIGLVQFDEMAQGKRGYYGVEKRYVRKSGEPFWVRLTLSLVHDVNGDPDYMVALIENIDQARHKSAALAESEARFRTMFDTAAVGIGLLGLDRRVIDVNESLCRMYGRTREELLGQTPALVSHPDDFERASQQHRDLLAGKFDHYFDERRYVRKNGEVFWASISMSLVRDENGSPLYIVGMLTDINEQKQVQDTLRESEARFKAMYDNATVGMALISLDRKVISLNQTAAQITGYTIEELIGTDPSRLAYPDDAAIGGEQFGDLVTGKIDSFQMEKRYMRKNGEVFWGRVTYSVVPGKDGKPIYLAGLFEDINDQKLTNDKIAAQEAAYRQLLEQRIAERTEELNKANERLSEKAAQDAVTAERTRLARDLHDAVTQTLFSTTLIADVLPELWKMNPAEGQRSLEELRQLTRGALAEMRTLLVELRPSSLMEVPLPILLRQLAEAVTGRARVQVQLNAEGECKLPPEVQVSLYRIAQEALNNITKHARATQAVITLRLGETVRLMIADNGAGFDPTTVTADHLGVRIMRERAAQIGAKLNLYSEPGEGTQISVVWSDR